MYVREAKRREIRDGERNVLESSFTLFERSCRIGITISSTSSTNTGRSTKTTWVKRNSSHLHGDGFLNIDLVYQKQQQHQQPQQPIPHQWHQTPVRLHHHVQRSLNSIMMHQILMN